MKVYDRELTSLPTDKKQGEEVVLKSRPLQFDWWVLHLMQLDLLAHTRAQSWTESNLMRQL